MPVSGLMTPHHHHHRHHHRIRLCVLTVKHHRWYLYHLMSSTRCCEVIGDPAEVNEVLLVLVEEAHRPREER